MATTIGGGSGDTRRNISSPRPKGRENAKNTLCRNVSIYGHCRYENDGCAFLHEKTAKPPTMQNNNNNNDSLRKRLNVDSPSFTPLQPSANGLNSGSSSRIGSAAISPKAASAAIFTPKSTKTANFTPAPAPPVPQVREPSAEWGSHDFQEFIPGAYDVTQIQDMNAQQSMLNSYDPFTVQPPVPGMSNGNQNAQINPYAAQDAANLAGTQFFQPNNGFAQPLQYHLYAPSGPSKEHLLDYQRTAYDFFIPEDLREDLHRKSEATRQILPQSSLPAQVDVFHSLVPLDTNHQRNALLFGYPTWIYKAVSSKDGSTYALRRLEGYKLTDERTIRAVRPWNRIRNGGVVSVHAAITTRAFGDSSLVFVTDYHPLAKTLAEHFFTQAGRFPGTRPSPQAIPEQDLWSYIVQIASALKAIHSNGLAAQVISPTKVLITSKGRIRLNSCGILDVVQYEAQRSVSELQQEDLIQLGRLVLALASHNINPLQNPQKSFDTLTRFYSPRLKDCVNWLLSPAPPPSTPLSPTSPTTPNQQTLKSIDIFISEIAAQVTAVLDNTFHAEDTLTSVLSRELENGRIVRLMTKLNMINERPDFFEQSQWSETGERYYLKLFRDFVFHQVDARGAPVTDLAHVIGCLNKLDAGSEEKVVLTSRDEQNVLVVSYREVKRGLDLAWQELLKAGRRT
ncbi:PAB-dependent poly(A)-specific ribonuclease subunit pan3 [Rhizodiscina lignyota]|uniref:PAN2-PAN3 deadenylation complex subunit PAN3 n=1 Tax=Rhizodiscina lignyota TaxID=1504668 RepID=A0A9P4IR57_9PEZI|nr:PAB-dependent poly(A)-specific ribonuclease subunit pan3 [Rhizodiscina lignyota]